MSEVSVLEVSLYGEPVGTLTRLGDDLHIEDFAQIFRVYPNDKYGKASYRNVASVIAVEGTDADTTEFVRRLTFNTLIGNADMHLKNWSMIYPDRRTAALSPAYDFVSTIAFIPDSKASLTFSRTKRFDGFSEDELSRLAARARISETLTLRTARETATLFHEHWQREKNNPGLTGAMVNAIEDHLRALPALLRPR